MRKVLRNTKLRCIIGLGAPYSGTNTLGRGGFLIHGDSVRAPGTASQGCIIMDPATRQRISSSGDVDLTVTR
jgi:hypothetical protein